MKIVVLEVTYSCNQTCTFCYNSWYAPGSKNVSKKVLSPQKFCRILDKMKEWEADNVGFSGGEPLMNPDIFEIAEYSRANGFKNSLLTNGQLVDRYSKEIADVFDVIQFALHGKEFSHNRLTGGNHYNNSLNGLLSLHEYDLPLSFAMVVNKQNLSEIGDLFELAGALDIKSFLINRFLPAGRGLENVEELILNEKETILMLEEVERASGEYGVPAFVGTPTPLCLDGLREYNFLLKEGCVAGRGLHCVVDPSGGLKVCNNSQTILGNCLENHPREIYEQSSHVKGFVELRYTPKMCDECDKVEKCKGGCRESANVLFGDLCAPDPVFCFK